MHTAKHRDASVHAMYHATRLACYTIMTTAWKCGRRQNALQRTTAWTQMERPLRRHRVASIHLDIGIRSLGSDNDATHLRHYRRLRCL